MWLKGKMINIPEISNVLLLPNTVWIDMSEVEKLSMIFFGVSEMN